MGKVGFRNLGTQFRDPQIQPCGQYPHLFLADGFLQIPERGLIQVIGFGQAQIPFITAFERLVNTNDGI